MPLHAPGLIATSHRAIRARSMAFEHRSAKTFRTFGPPARARTVVTLISVWQGAHAVEEAADAAHSTQVERAALLCLRRSRYAAERAVCVHA